MSNAAELTPFIRDVPDFPRPGILFKDITPLLMDAAALRRSVELMTEIVRPMRPDLIVAIESRGFLFGVPLALSLGAGFVPVRKPGKLPYRTLRADYELEYGSGTLEIHADLPPGRRVVVVDDLLATGGTAAGAAQLCERQGAHVAGYAFVIELGFLNGLQYKELIGDLFLAKRRPEALEKAGRKDLQPTLAALADDVLKNPARFVDILREKRDFLSAHYQTCTEEIENGGHRFGEDLSDADKKALTAFLATL